MKIEGTLGEDFGGVAVEQSRRAAALARNLATVVAANGNFVDSGADLLAYRPERKNHVRPNERKHPKADQQEAAWWPKAIRWRQTEERGRREPGW